METNLSRKYLSSKVPSYKKIITQNHTYIPKEILQKKAKGIDWKNEQRRNTSTSLQDYVDDCLVIPETSSSECGKHSWGIYYVDSRTAGVC